MRRGRRIAVLTALLAMVMVSTANANQSATVTRGQFTTLPGGTAHGYEITGHAVMVRVPGSDTTRVTVHARGLDPDENYKVHVHNASCDATPAGGGHYQHEVGGAVDAVNEIWPAISTNAAGVGRGVAVHDHVARTDAQAVVIHWPDDAAVRLACLDLG